MTTNIEMISMAVGLIIKSAILAARFSGRTRKRSLKRLSEMNTDEKDKEIIFLRDKINQQKMQICILQKGLKNKHTNNRYTPREKLYILHYMETFQIARHRVSEHLGIARSTLYRWLHAIEDKSRTATPANKTPAQIAVMVWGIAKANADWGRMRIANQMALLKILLSASTVRNILNQPKPPSGPKKVLEPKMRQEKNARSVPAWYPNHVWSIDTTMVFCWGLWPIHICVVIDHFSRKVMAATPLEGPNAGWTVNALESAIEKYGPPKHLISDQGIIFTNEAFAELLDKHQIKHRFGAIGKHGSIAVTERVNKTLKYEWLKQATFIKGIDHLTDLCEEFQIWYNQWRPHMTLDGLRPDDVFYKNRPDKPGHNAKTIPCDIERHYFRSTRITGYRIQQVA